jgi:hypothetical protein
MKKARQLRRTGPGGVSAGESDGGVALGVALGEAVGAVSNVAFGVVVGVAFGVAAGFGVACGTNEIVSKRRLHTSVCSLRTAAITFMFNDAARNT